MSNPRIKNGRFITKKKGARNVRAIAAMSTAKKKKIQELLSEQNKDRVKIGEGSRIVQLKYIAKNLKCLKCKSFRFRKSDAGKTIWPPFSFRHKMRSM